MIENWFLEQNFPIRLILPELVILTAACVVLLVDVYQKNTHSTVTYYLSQISLLIAASLTFELWGSQPQTAFGASAFANDDFAHLLKLCIYLATFFVFVHSRDYIRVRNILWGEYYVLGLFAVLGMMILVSARSLLTLYLGLELLSLSLYAMVAMSRDKEQSSEAALKYFVMGALASGLLLYGMSLLYGASGSLELSQIAQHLSTVEANPAIAVTDSRLFQFALVFVVAGVAFKLALVPFHMWVPDVYQGAPNTVAAFISTAPKIAAFAMIVRLLGEALPALIADWQQLLMILAVLSLVVGNVVAIVQTNLKRLLGYSTMAHMGFVTLGLVAGTELGLGAALFYVIIYALMSLAAFGVMILLSKEGFEAEEINDFRGLNARNRWYAFMMLVTMFSLIGIPPTVGFYAKLVILQSLIAVDLVGLAVFAVVMSVIGAFYYLKIVKVMYFDTPEDVSPISASFGQRAAVSINGISLLALGIFPTALLAVCLAVMSA